MEWGSALDPLSGGAKEHPSDLEHPPSAEGRGGWALGHGWVRSACPLEAGLPSPGLKHGLANIFPPLPQDPCGFAGMSSLARASTV